MIKITGKNIDAMIESMRHLGVTRTSIREIGNGHYEVTEVPEMTTHDCKVAGRMDMLEGEACNWCDND